MVASEDETVIQRLRFNIEIKYIYITARVTINGEQMAELSTFKYFGVTLSEDCTVNAENLHKDCNCYSSYGQTGNVMEEQHQHPD